MTFLYWWVDCFGCARGGGGWGGARVYEILKENLKLHYLCVKSTHPAIRRRGDVVTTSQVTLS